MLGIGGVVGTLAGGTVVGKSKMESTSTIEFKERIIAIPPHSKYLLDDTQTFGTAGRLKVGEEKSYSETSSPNKREYIFTYSNNQQFNELSTIKLSTYIAKEIGCRFILKEDYASKITGYNGYTLLDLVYVPR